MAYNSVKNPAAFQGVASPWALNFAAMVAEHLSYLGGFSPSLGYDMKAEQPFFVVPSISRDKLSVFAVYAPTLGGSKMKEFSWWATVGVVDTLKRHWTTYGAAYVEFEIDPCRHQPFHVFGHDGATRTVSALGSFALRSFPTLQDFDDTLGTELVKTRSDWLLAVEADTRKAMKVVAGGEPHTEVQGVC